MNKIELMLIALRDSYENMYEIFTEGSCFQLYLVLKALHPEAVPYWSDKQNHAVTKVGEFYYDIGGILNTKHVESPEQGAYYIVTPEKIAGYSLLKYTSKEESRDITIERYEHN
jgi:hypothetical protein|tara:strand:- start:15313 stop:15654 length:342 start_codon:yes stop_codon:yes gene_type:complete